MTSHVLSLIPTQAIGDFINRLLQHPLCALHGHNPETIRAGYYRDRYGYSRQRYDFRCSRCYAGRDEMYEAPGLIEALQRLRGRVAHFIHFRCFRRCVDCHKPDLILGKRVGRHPDCIPF